MKPIIALTHEELRALLTKARDHDHRCYLMFLVATVHGLRVSEVIELKAKNFRFDGSNWYIETRRLKGSLTTNQRLLSSPDPLFDEARLVSEWLIGMKPNAYVFTNAKGERFTRWGVSYFMEQYSRWAGIPEHKRHCHVLKHTAGVLMRKSGATLEQIQARLGHKRLDSTAQYLRVTQDEVDSAAERAFVAGASAIAAAMRH